jgi:hypothetical protein
MQQPDINKGDITTSNAVRKSIPVNKNREKMKMSFLGLGSKYKKTFLNCRPVAHACNSSYLGG